MQAYYKLWATHIPKNISPFINEMRAYKNKLSFDIKRVLYTEELTHFETMNLTYIVWLYNKSIV